MKFLNKIGKDKYIHFIVGYLLFCIGLMVGMNWVASMLLVIVMATGKEIFDYMNRFGTPDCMDLIATILGAIPALILVLLGVI